MQSDKILTLLEKQLKVMGKKIRIDILKKLQYTEKPISYSTLQRSIITENNNTTNLSFHLNSLKEIELVESTDEGYVLTSLGKKMLDALLSIERIINEENKTLMIRTSKYSKEPFDLRKIENYLQKEGEISSFMAGKIAKQVKNRLFKANIEYLTAPLMREYINAILLEEGLEKVRHKLTRLGTPPYDTKMLFMDYNLTPDKFLNKLGSDISEQFLLLNILPNDLADLYLSGQVILLDLNYWALKPSGLFIPRKSLIDYIQSNPISSILNFIYSFISNDLTIGNLNNFFLDENPEIDLERKFLNELTNVIPYLNLNALKLPNILLEIIENEGLIIGSKDLYENNAFFRTLRKLNQKYNSNMKNPFYFLIDYPNLTSDEFNLIINSEHIKNGFLQHLIFQNSSHQCLNTNLINQKARKDSDLSLKLILDKIIINLIPISNNAQGNDNLFFELLEERILNTSRFIKIKKDLIEKRYKNNLEFKKVFSKLLSHPIELIRKSSASISLLGLHESIQLHCGIEFERLKTSESFLWKILKFTQDVIDEINQEDTLEYLLSQSHSILNPNTFSENKYIKNHNIESLKTKIVDSDLNISFDKTLEIAKKFQKRVKGGSLFNYNLDFNTENFNSIISKIINKKLPGFAFNTNLTH